MHANSERTHAFFCYYDLHKHFLRKVIQNGADIGKIRKSFSKFDIFSFKRIIFTKIGVLFFMGMDYSYAGSASYPRFDREVCEVAKIFGGIKTEHLREREATENERPCGYWFGFLSSDNTDIPKFTFPDTTNDILVKWFNHIYDYFTPRETQTVAEQIFSHPEIKEISHQTWIELEESLTWKTGWNIH